MSTSASPATLPIAQSPFGVAEVSRLVSTLATTSDAVLSVGQTLTHPSLAVDSVGVGTAASAGLDCDPACYGLALIHPQGDFAAGLFGYEAVVGLANVLASLQGGARVVWLGPDDAAASFAAFGLSVATVSAAEPVGLIGRLLGRRMDGPSAVVGTVPQQPLTKLEYHAIARDLVMASMRAAA